MSFNQFESTQLCGSTSMDSTHSTLRGHVLPCNQIEYYVIVNVTPMGPEYPVPSYYGL